MAVRKWGVAPQAWGAVLNYDTMKLQPWDPRWWVVHHNGGPVQVADRDDEEAYLRLVDNYHAKWTNRFAYGYAIGTATATIYRGRGENRSGAQWNDMNNYCRAVLFTQGSGQGLPSIYARRAFARMVLEDPMPVITHKMANRIGQDPATSCPGDLCGWVEDGGFADDFGALAKGAVSGRVTSLRRRLKDLGYISYIGGPNWRRRYTPGTEQAVIRFQADAGITKDGIVGVQTYRALTGMPITDPQAWGDESGSG